MNAVPNPDQNPSLLRQHLTRRRLLGAMGAAGALGAGSVLASRASWPAVANESAEESLARAAAEFDSVGGSASADSQAPIGRTLPGAVDGRVLVVVDLLGGNDGLSTLAPLENSRYYDLRPGLAHDPAELLAVDDEVGLHPSLVGLHRRGVTTIEGVGPVDGDLSHFAMSQRWQTGDVAGTARYRSGFLGRIVDALYRDSPLTGLSLAGPVPHLLGMKAATMSLSSPDSLWFLRPTDWYETGAFQRATAAFSSPEASELFEDIFASNRSLLDLAQKLGPDDGEGSATEPDWESRMLSEGGQLGQRLHLAAELIHSDLGVRVIYVSDGDYDTHEGHQWRHAQNLTRLDAAVDGFLERADELGFADRVLVATTSEFGRRVMENDGGLDHGSASTMLVAGPIASKRLGEAPPIDDLDDDGNLKVTTSFDRYLAALAQDWMGVEAASVLADSPDPVEGLV